MVVQDYKIIMMEITTTMQVAVVVVHKAQQHLVMVV
jgi:hypothetical protein